MVVHDLDRVRITISPFEADPPTLIDADAVLAGSIPTQLLKAIGRRDPEISQGLSIVDHPEFAVRHLLYVRREAARELAFKDMLGLPVGDGLDHKGSI